MKRTTAFFLALLLALSLSVPAMASEEPATDEEAPSVVLWEPDDPEESPAETEAPAEDTVPEDAAPAEEETSGGMDAALTDLVLQVKEILEVDDGYTNFTNDFYDGLTPYWSLGWSDDTRQLNVDVREDGTVLNVNFWDDSNDSDQFYGFDPAFPALTKAEAEEQAETWLSKLFTGPETGRVDSMLVYLGADGYYRFSGTVEKNGLPSPVTFTLSISGTGLAAFNRSDSYGGYVGELPSAEAVVDEAAGAKGLAGAVKMDLYYVSDGEGGANLQYVPVGPYTVVDAQSGEAVDMDALYDSLGGGNWNSPYIRDTGAAQDVEESAALTEAEQTSIENYSEAMDQDELDASLRQLTALGLDGFQMQLCSYAMDDETGDVTASLRYTAPMTGEELYGYSASGYDTSAEMEMDLIITKQITVNAKTGELMRVYTTYPLWEKDPNVTMTKAVRNRAAENFLSLAAPELAEETELCTLKGYNEEDAVTFAQVHDGYFYPDNYLSVTVNPSTGTVDAFTREWEDVQFGPSEDPVTDKEAKSAYTKALDVTLGYVAWPLDITQEESGVYTDLLLEQGYVYVEELRLGYYYDGTDAVQGVDALTGEIVSAEEDQVEDVFTYDDLKNVPEAAEIEALGEAGIGFTGERFRPEAELTQRDAIWLLLQADGETIADSETDEGLQERSSWRGFVAEDDWDPDKTVTRMEFIRMLLGASRYGDAARLMSDKADEGYEIIAESLGMDTAGPDKPITRADAAEILYLFMDR